MTPRKDGGGSKKPGDTYKRCPRCNKQKPLSEFNIRRARPDGHGVWCRRCNRESIMFSQRVHERLGEPLLADAGGRTGLL